MQQGVERIYQGVLLKVEVINQSEIVENRDNLAESEQIIKIKLVSSPELLVKQPGFSKFGDWVYVSQDIKLGKRPKLDYQVISAFHAYLLEDIQGIQPETGWLILRDKAPYSVNLEQRLPKMHEVLKNYLNMVLSDQEPEVFIARQKCNLCQWNSYCLDVARSQNHISLIPGVTPTRYLRLQELNLTTVETLANATPDQLEVYPEFVEGVALQIIKQAESNLESKAIKRQEEFISFEENFNSSEWIDIFHNNSQTKLKKISR
jgi:Predicted nuclease (RecB family)